MKTIIKKKSVLLFKVLLLFFMVFYSVNSFAQPLWQIYPYSPPGSVLTFPYDDGYHPDASTLTEWWYINLHLIGSSPQYKQYDVMLVYFRFANMRIFNISESSGTFHSNVLQLYPTFTFQLNNWDLTYTVPLLINDFSKWTYPVDNISYKYDFFAEEPSNDDMLNVTVTSNRAPLVVGGDGFIPLGNQGDSSFYYSYTNMKTEGTIRYNGVDDIITSGVAWIDRQWGPFTVGVNADNKYEWFSLQMDKQGTILGQPQTPSEFNIWQIFSDTSSIPYSPEWRMVSSIFPDNTQDTSSTFFFERTGYWHDIANNKYYSSRWRFIEPNHGVSIDVIPNIANQIVDVTLFKFWEGSTTLKGTVNNLPVEGVGFAELVADHNFEIILPSVPSGLNVTSYSDHYSLNWIACTPGTYPIGGYRIYRSPNNNGYWQYIATTSNLFYDDYSAASDSSYFYTVTSFDNQTATSASNYATPVPAYPSGINVVDNKNIFLKIYPNPTSGKIAVTISSGSIDKIEIYNVMREKVYSSLVYFPVTKAPMTIDMSLYPNGVYFIRLQTREEIFNQKFILQKGSIKH